MKVLLRSFTEILPFESELIAKDSMASEVISNLNSKTENESESNLSITHNNYDGICI